MILRSVRPLFRLDDRLKTGHSNGHTGEAELFGVTGQLVVGQVMSLSIWHVDQDIERAGIGSPGRDLRTTQREPIDLYGQLRRLGVGQSRNTEPSVQLPHGRSQAIEVLRTSTDEAIKVLSRPGRSVGLGGHSSNDEVLDPM